jgi:uncharacterized protein (DUF885 family)
MLRIAHLCRLTTTSLVAVLSALACFSVAPAAQSASTGADDVAKQITRLADAYVSEFVKRFPEQAEWSGLTLERHDGLTDNSLAALASWYALEDGWWQQIERIDPTTLAGRPQWMTLGFLREAIQASRQLRVCRYELWPVNQLSGWQSLLSRLAETQPVGSERARSEALARWQRMPQYLDTEIGNLREGVAKGYTTPRRNVQLVIEQLEEILREPVDKWQFNGPAQRDKTPEFQKAWLALLSTQIKPAVERYRNYLRDEYVKRARESIAITANTDGATCYDASFRYYTTIDRSGKETFELGQRVVNRNLQEALTIGRAKLKAADLKRLVERLNTDSANRFNTREELLAFAHEAVTRARVVMPKAFSRVPKADVVVEPYPSFLERTASDSYSPAAADGSRPATYRITLYRSKEVTRSNAEITAFHETYPGHHLQIALALERPNAHTITKLIGNSGFWEGWARYAEALAEELGMYSSDYALANRRLWPARGMMIDPGIHLLGWTREQAAAFAIESGRFTPDEAAALVDRVAVWPAQLTAYDTGGIEFFALREQAKKSLGERFDLRTFHAVVLGGGPLTLPMLRERVRTWLETGKAP